MKNKVAEIYDKIAEDYDKYFADDSIANAENKLIFSELEKELNLSKDTLVDLGCGDGLFLAHLSDYNSENYYGIDISRKMLELGRKRFPSYKFFYDDMVCTGFKDDSFDYAVSLFGALSYVDEFEHFKAELQRILKPKGKFFVMLYSRRYKERKSYILKNYKLDDEVEATYWDLDDISNKFSDFADFEVEGLNYYVDEFYNKKDDENEILEVLKKERELFKDNPKIEPYFYIVKGQLK